MKKIITYSFLVLNLMRSAEICYSSSELSEYPQKRVLEAIKEVKRYPIAMPLSVIESSEGYIKTKSQKPINTARKQNAATFSISATAIRESSSFQKEYKEKNNGCDGRRKIEKTDEWPYSVHGAVFATFSNGTKKWGTGTLIAPNLVLTAAHNLYDMDYDIEKMREATKVEFCPAMNGDKIFFGKIEIIKHYFPEEYKISGDTSFDYGILVLNRSVGQETGYFGLGIISEDKLKSASINVTGYPGDKVPDKSGWYEMWTMEGPIKNIQDGLINYTINTYSGQSGAGIWYQEGENHLVAGVHVAGDKDFNSAVLLTRVRYEQITEWVKDSVLQTIDKSLPSLSFPNVTMLDLSEKKIGDIEMRLFTSDRFPHLTSLDLTRNNIDDLGATELAKLTSLNTLDLSNNNIGDLGATELAKLTNLNKLYLGCNNIGDLGATELAKLTNLNTLYLINNNIVDLGATELAKLTNLTYLNLSWNNIGNRGATELAKLTNLSTLNLESSKISDIGATELAKLTNLTYLNLVWNNIGGRGATELAKLTSLNMLYLGHNNIGNRGATKLAKLTSLNMLILRRNNISDRGTTELTKLINLNMLYLGYNNIGDLGAIGLAKLTKLNTLDLSMNNISDLGATELAKLTNLTYLHLYDNKIGEESKINLRAKFRTKYLYL